MALAKYHFVLPGKILNALVFLTNGASVLILCPTYSCWAVRGGLYILVSGYYQPQVLEPCHSPEEI